MRRAVPALVLPFLCAGLFLASPQAWAEASPGDLSRHPARLEAATPRPASPRVRPPRPSPASRADLSAWDLVWRSEAADQQLSLRGRVRTTVRFGPRQESAIAEVIAARGKLRLDFESGSRRWSLVDDGRSLVKLRPGRDRPEILPRPAFITDRALAERNYTARLLQKERVADRPTQVVEIASRASGASTWRLWVDEETFLALRRERYNAEGELTTSTEYLAVEFGVSVPEESFSLPSARQRPTPPPPKEQSLSLEALAKAVGFPVHTPRYLPPGYRLQGRYARGQGRGGGPGHGRGARPKSAELRYTDGIRLLSVLQWEATPVPAPPEPPPSHEQSRRRWRGGKGKTGQGSARVLDHGSEKILRYHGPERVVMVIGDLPEKTLAQIAQSLEGN